MEMGMEMADHNQEIVCDVTIVGAGLAGLVASIMLSRAGFKVILIEKKTFPFHKVCGEYVSNEVKPFLQNIGINFSALNPADITELEVHSANGKIKVYSHLPLGGFGISRFKLDNELYQLAIDSGARIFENNRVLNVTAENKNDKTILSNGKIIQSKLVIGSYGKRDGLDNKLDRNFIKFRSNYMAVKYHIKTAHPEQLISLYNFNGGYCGLNKIEEDLYCLCYLVDREIFKRFKTIDSFENQVLLMQPQLKHVLENSDILYERPLVINEFSFRKKLPVEKKIFMCGDSAGLITPLCGNGMSMAIHAAKILSELIILANPASEKFDREKLENDYLRQWNFHFKNRLRVGRILQNFTGNSMMNSSFLKILNQNEKLTTWVVSKTHGITI
jgi:menaquinone-9 beta-reductase